jgi:hypothetical protein
MLSYYRERLGGDGPFTCEVELTADSLAIRQCGAELKYLWSSMTEIVDTPGGIEFAARGGGFLVVRDRAFLTPQQRSDFLLAARQLMSNAGAAGGTPPGPGGDAEGSR